MPTLKIPSTGTVAAIQLFEHTQIQHTLDKLAKMEVGTLLSKWQEKNLVIYALSTMTATSGYLQQFPFEKQVY